jgi:hypothetical protein
VRPRVSPPPTPWHDHPVEFGGVDQVLELLEILAQHLHQFALDHAQLLGQLVVARDRRLRRLTRRGLDHVHQVQDLVVQHRREVQDVLRRLRLRLQHLALDVGELAGQRLSRLLDDLVLAHLRDGFGLIAHGARLADHLVTGLHVLPQRLGQGEAGLVRLLRHVEARVGLHLERHGLREVTDGEACLVGAGHYLRTARAAPQHRVVDQVRIGQAQVPDVAVHAGVGAERARVEEFREHPAPDVRCGTLLGLAG